MEMIELFSGEYGKHIMIGFMVGAPAGYAFATRTALKVAKETISQKQDEVLKLQEQVKGYVEKLIK